MKRVLVLLVFAIILFGGCTNVREDIEGTKINENSEYPEIPEPIVEPVSENNQFFFQNICEPIYYEATYTFADSKDLPDRIALIVTEREKTESGILYEMRLDYNKEFSGRDYFGWDRFWLGYFFVQGQEIYLLRNEKLSDIIGNEKELINRGTLICNYEGVSDELGEEGWHSYITVDGNRREYHSYNNGTETGFYEAFIWEQGKGLISYRSGIGAEGDAIELQLDTYN